MVVVVFKRMMLLILLMVGFSSVSFADFYVIPVNKKIKNVIIVAKSGGQFTNLQAALASIPDASSDNPYVIYIGPGIYTVDDTIQLYSYVSVVGSGEGKTILTGAISSDTYNETSAILWGSSYADVSHLTIKNTGTGTYSSGIYNLQVSPKYSNITIEVSGGSTGFGVINDALAKPVMRHMKITAQGSFEAYGIHNLATSSADINDVNVGGFAGSYGAGILVDNSGTPIISNSILNGSTRSIAGGNVRFSTLLQTSNVASTCSFCVDATGQAYNSNCTLP